LDAECCRNLKIKYPPNATSRRTSPIAAIRGVVLGVLAAVAGAPLIGLGPEVGVLVGSLAMAGDLVSSFVKRRMDLPPSSRPRGLDQVPESLLPLLVCRNLYRPPRAAMVRRRRRG
jgi:hypothetical protein